MGSLTRLPQLALFAAVAFATSCSSDASPDNDRRANGIGAAGSAAAPAPPGVGAAGAAGTAGGAAGTDTNFGQAPVQPTLGADVELEPESCARADVIASRIVPTVMLLVDGSQSMMDNCYPAPATPDDGSDPPLCIPARNDGASRWDALRGALTAPDGFITTLEGVVKFGLAVYGTMPTCPLPLGIVDPALGNAATVISSLPAQAPGRTTPTGAALREVVNLLPDPTQAIDEIIGPQIIILATDGDPNSCDNFTNATLEESVQAALMAQAKNLSMYVIGVGSDSSAAHLQELANVGAGMDRASAMPAEVFYPEDPAALSATLMSLVGEAISCELELEGHGVQQDKECNGSIVTLNGNELECNGTHGWRLKSSNVIELVGSACEQLQNDVSAQLSANFLCEILLD